MSDSICPHGYFPKHSCIQCVGLAATINSAVKSGVEIKLGDIGFNHPGPRPVDEPRCPYCGYTEEDKRTHMDHHLCDAKNKPVTATPTGEELYAAYRRNLHKEHSPQGTIDELKTLVTSIRLYAIPELPANEKGQVPFFRAFFDSVVDEIEASIRRQETDRETAAANENYIRAIPALCRGEVVPCALHVSEPIAELRKERDGLAMRAREVTCVWCGHQFESTLQSQAEHLYTHAKSCGKHPVNRLESENAALREKLAEAKEAFEKIRRHAVTEECGHRWADECVTWMQGIAAAFLAGGEVSS